MPRALEGITVVDCTRAVAGPYCAMLLGDLGADVIKIEAPEVGDECRAYSPTYGDESCYFLIANRNKRSLTLNLKDPQSRPILDRLLAKADVFIENFRPQALARLGLGYETLGPRFPRLVYCSITGFGPVGPMSERPAMDALIQAFTGLMSVTGEPGRPPVRLGVAVADLGTALHAAYGIVAAIAARHRTGRGQKVETSLMESSVALASYHNAMFWGTGKSPERLGSAHAAMAPLQVFELADGYMLIMAGNQRQWHSLCDVMGIAELKADPRFLNNADRVRNRGELHDLLGRIFLRHMRADLAARFANSEVLHAPINTIEDTLSEPQVREREMVIERPHPTLGSMNFTGFPVKFSDTPAQFVRDPPAIGEHNREILAALGYDDAAIAAFARSGTI